MIMHATQPIPSQGGMVYLLRIEQEPSGRYTARAQDETGLWFWQTDASYKHQVSAEMLAMNAIVEHYGGYGFIVVDCSSDEG